MATINSGSGRVFGHPTTFQANDPVRVIEAKILNALTSGGSGVTSGIVASGTADPNTLGLGANVLIYNQFDGSNTFVRQWERDATGTFQ